jgi:L-idonate 5-dehydrogenase
LRIGTLGTEDIPLPANQLMAREIQFLGSFRYGNVFGEAIRLAASNRVNLRPLISQVFPLRQVVEAILCASARNQMLKVQMEIS